MKAKTADTYLIASLYFCDGRRPEVIDAVAKSIAAYRSCRLINVHPDKHYDRTNLVFCAPATVIVKAIQSVATEVFARIKLSIRDEELAALGSLDLVSIIPFSFSQMPTAKEVAVSVAKNLHQTFNIPVYIFAETATEQSRLDFRVFRQFSHKDLEHVIASDDWQPDFQAKQLEPDQGVAVVGARLFHLNFAIYFDTEDIELIDELSKVHERVPEEEKNQNHGDRTFEEIAGLLKQVNTFVDDRPDKKVVRMLCNVPNYRNTMLSDLVEVFTHEAAQLGIETIGSRVLGFIPCEAITEFNPEDDKIESHLSIEAQKLKLSAIEPFNMKRQVLDFYRNRR
ncbi:MAG: hypothetical protein AAFP70_03895 [Calditrichota bacterium]